MRPLVVLVIPLAACLPELPGDDTGALATDRDHDGTPDGEDCAPADPSVHPGAEEACNTQDDDCDGATDEGVLTDYYADVDGDGYGDAANVVPACGPSDGWVLDATDCDDAHADASPAGVEVCDGLDNDCAGGVDDGVGEDLYADVDGDGYGDPSAAIRSCSDVDGYVADATDCDDSDPSVHPPSRECHPAGTYGLAEADYKLVGTAGGDYAGAVAFAGDLDGDGYGDVVVSAGVAGTNDAGAVYVVGGPAPAASSLAAAQGTLTGEGAGDWAGYVGAAAVGDVDGDGNPDLLVDAFLNDDGGVDAGAAYLVLGPVSGVASLGSAAAELSGSAAGDLAGCAVSGAGDVDQDGVPDLLIGSCLDDAGGSNSGAAYVVSAAARGDVRLGSEGATLAGESPDDEAGTSIAGAGDADGDGVADVLVGARGDDDGGENAGAAYLLLGPVGSMDLSAADVKLVGEAEGDGAGSSVSIAGDFDGDGRADIVIGAATESSLAAHAGAAYLVLGPASSIVDLGSAHTKVLGEDENGELGGTGITAGDVDGDHRADLLVTSCNNGDGGASAGAAYMWLSPSAGALDLSSADLQLTGDTAGDRVAYTALGDVDGDGWTDLLVGARGDDDGGTDAGAVWIWFGDGF